MNAPSEKLLAFFRSEFENEEASGFVRLRRVPDSYVEESIAYYQSLSKDDRASWVDCCAHWAHMNYGFVVGAPQIDHTKHPFFERWIDNLLRFPFRSPRNVPNCRLTTAQYKMDMKKDGWSSVTEEEFRFAECVRSVKAPELRKRVRAVLNNLGYRKVDQYGGHRCVWNGLEFEVNADFSGRHAQLRYSVTPSESHEMPNFVRSEFCFERALGMGYGHWNFIVEENVDNVFLLFKELIKYAVALPGRIRDAAA